MDLPVVRDVPLAGALFARARVGDYVEAEHFSAIVSHLVRLDLV